MIKKSVVVNPFLYKKENLKDVEEYIYSIRDDFDVSVILEDIEPYEENGIKYVPNGSRRKSYLDVSADYILDAGAISGTSKLSTSQKRIVIMNDKLIEAYSCDEESKNSLEVIDYSANMDAIVVRDNADSAFVDNTFYFRGKRIQEKIENDSRKIEYVSNDTKKRKYPEVIFLMNILNHKDEMHTEIIKLGAMLKKAFNIKTYAVGIKDFEIESDEWFFDAQNIIDVKLSTENNPGTVRCVLTETDGIIVICDEESKKVYRDYISNKKRIHLCKDKKSKKLIVKDGVFNNKRNWDKIISSILEDEDAASVRLIKKKTFPKRVMRKICRMTKSAPADTASIIPREETSHIVEKEENPFVSVVIPFYKDKDTINRAVASIQNNGYEEYEIILVNDGSQEDPMLYIDNPNRIRSVYKENGGPGSARNMGIELARGKYLLFLDADDVSLPGAIRSMVDYAESKGLGVVAGKTIRHYLNNGKEEAWYGSIYSAAYINEKRDRGLIIDDNLCHGRIFNVAFLIDNNIKFIDGLYEDADFMSKVYAKVSKIGIIPNAVQKWMIYGDGTTRSTENTYKNAEDRLRVADNIYTNSQGTLRAYYTRQYIRHHLIAAVNGYINFTEEERRKLFNKMKEGIGLRKETILDRLILMPAKKEMYKALLTDDYERFDLIASSFSGAYQKAISS